MTRPDKPLRVAVLGAESTGKTALTQALAQALRERGVRAKVVPEYLREWCDAAARTPAPHEQRAIAREQARRILAVRDADLVLADTTPLMTAIYSELLFADRTLHPFALAHQRHYDLTLLTGLDLPWVSDGLQRDGPHVREPVDRLVRSALREAALSWHVVYGRGNARRDHALDAIFSVALIDHLALGYREKPSNHTRWSPLCTHCGDPTAEGRLFRGLAG